MAQLTIKVGSNIITEPIYEFGIFLMNFLKRRYNVNLRLEAGHIE